ncbi:AGC family protein kinase [Trichomonas vaginalis G3]|uniref:AGC family protein kinase n=1 Tax=Trichomonas vaginalis (strain ATCC PRA-98 / G3) TaxID=412133 RepID=A2EL25_TRIV3|nr:peptidyl-threonine phosphorylation [Trichomonas vaginalis G3]EAY06653.1 AGC family protein kinase [Trichomonas vaginalis G3]KAI5552870.1 peptidyl-threonine phosphorylation [Trichomonas vaginalis G3]|eukprot:XP_001318876.1 AGC family protein kinase [Trichomonas vaginalis G3]
MTCSISTEGNQDAPNDQLNQNSDGAGFYSLPRFIRNSLSDFLNSTNPVMHGYRFLSELGDGAMSRVFQVVYEGNDEVFAAKVYDNSQISRPTLSGEDPPYVCIQRELDIMAKLSHRYVISLIDAFNDNDTNCLFIIMPYAPMGNVKSLTNKKLLSENALNACYHQIAIALAYMHANNVVHRDIKPENMLAFSEDYFVITDLSVSQELTSDDQMLVDTKGSPAFLSPEECHGGKFSPKPTDVWAYGVSLYLSYFNDFPFSIGECEGLEFANTLMAVYLRLRTKELEIPANADPLLKDLLQHILVKDPKQRYTFDQIVAHEFFDRSRHIDEENAKDLDYEEEEMN